MDFKNLLAYKKSFDLAMKIFEITKNFPKEEKYSLIDQIRRSSRSVTANISESYRKRKYPKHFISKLTDCDSENAETQTWLEFSLACKYIDQKTFDQLISLSLEVGNLINYMINNPQKFGVKE
ncbi:four helix bundle protein [Aquimarina sp. MMG015]|uniref:four helix bundle protein n=1 Tax=Aquimarina sp. MMG015 TaxID=2822689 RepID=UPI001B3A111C|nr:four helix bundle protein [Aquimarina sp. MMG015]MBQ4803173.1 four helix bundle protein [Aquimarina sp. MMG015]